MLSAWMELGKVKSSLLYSLFKQNSIEHLNIMVEITSYLAWKCSCGILSPGVDRPKLREMNGRFIDKVKGGMNSMANWVMRQPVYWFGRPVEDVERP